MVSMILLKMQKAQYAGHLDIDLDIELLEGITKQLCTCTVNDCYIFSE